ncbi:MAG: asparagine synthetase B, partial [Thermoproteota archaeon]|nr:asparagine synthetase B [Thermoproteota archaeon]
MSKRNENIVPLVGTMLSCMTNRGPDGAGIAADEHSIQSNSFSNLRYHGLSGSSALGHVRLAIVGGTCGQQPFRSCDGGLTVEHNGEIYNYKKIRRRLINHHKFTTETDSEVIVHLMEDYFHRKNDLLYAIKKTIAELDGVYAFVIKEEESGTLALVRDKMGVRQIYYGENERFIAFASERKALWKIGIKEPTKRVLPCYAIVISPEGNIQEFKIANLPIPAQYTKKIRTTSSALNIYKKALLASMKKRTQDFDRVGIIFSGGIDSVIIAWIAKKMVPDVICYTGGVHGSNDILYARKIANKLDLKLRVNEL